MAHRELKPLPVTVEGVLGDIVSRLRDGEANIRMGEQMLGVVQGVIDRGEDPELGRAVAELQAETGGRDNLKKHLKVLGETIQLLETLRMERLVESATGDPFKGFKPRADQAISMPPPKGD